MSAPSKRRRMSGPRFRHRTAPGAPPGTLVPDPQAQPAQMHIIGFGPEAFEEQVTGKPEDIAPYLHKWPVTWIDVDGVGDAALVDQIGRLFNLHRLALEDVLHVHQRAKAEAFGDYWYVVVRMPMHGAELASEQVSFFLGENYVITFQEHAGGDCLEAVRQRIRTGWGRSRCARPDALFHALLDVIVDHYFPIVEACGDKLDDLEDALASGRDRHVMGAIHHAKRELLTVRRIMWPLRDAINTLLRDSGPLIGAEARIYLRDVHDHTIQMIDLVETYRDIASGLTDVYLSSVSQRTNEIMRVLTIISTIFIPLNFLAGVYGMNFNTERSPWNMPELNWYFGYPLLLGVMLLIVVGQLLIYQRRGWLRGKDG